jgi:hypothetical protein
MPTTVLIELTAVTCCNCGVVFGIEVSHQRRLRESGEWFHCPNGHRQHYTESEADRLRKRLAAVERSRDWANTSAQAARDQADAERRSHAATKGQLTKARKRIAAGVCPCCTRTFQNLARHMAGQHPSYGKAATDG